MFENFWKTPLLPFQTISEQHPGPHRNQWARQQPRLVMMLGLGCLLAAILAGCAPSGSSLAVIPVSGSPALEVYEYPLVEQSQDNPTHLGFQEHVRRAVLEQRQGWNRPRNDDLLAAQNQALAPFSFRLEASASPPFSGYVLYYQDAPLRQDIARFWPVSVKNAAPNQGSDFLLPFLTLSGEKLVASAAGVQPWPGQAQQEGRQAGNQVAYAQTQGGIASIYAGPSLLDNLPNPTPEADVQSAPGEQSLHTWDSSLDNHPHWALELEGNMIIDGQDVNETNNYQRAFGFQVVNGQPLYFYVKDGLTHLHYAGKDLPYMYDQVLHQNDGPLQVYNPGVAGNLVWFYALRDGLWYYVEAGTIG